jgi:hypothetical protein
MLPSTAAPVTGAAQRYALVEQHIITDFRRLADHNPQTVINEETTADPGAGMDLDSGHKARELRNHAGGYVSSPPVEPMSSAMKENSVQPRIAEQNLETALGGRVFPFDRADLLAQRHKCLFSNRDANRLE